MKRMNFIVLVVAALMTLPVQASLIINGSFEGSIGSEWGFTDASGPSSIETAGSNYGGVASIDGRHIELHGSGSPTYTLWQTFATSAGVNYMFDFAYIARGDIPVTQMFRIEILNAANNAVLFTQDVLNDNKTAWTYFSSVFNNQFTATSTMSTLRVTSLLPDANAPSWYATGGNHLDLFSAAVAPASVSEPSLLAVFALALVAMVRRSKAKKA